MEEGVGDQADHSWLGVVWQYDGGMHAGGQEEAVDCDLPGPFVPPCMDLLCHGVDWQGEVGQAPYCALAGEG